MQAEGGEDFAVKFCFGLNQAHFSDMNKNVSEFGF